MKFMFEDSMLPADASAFEFKKMTPEIAKKGLEFYVKSCNGLTDWDLDLLSKEIKESQRQRSLKCLTYLCL